MKPAQQTALKPLERRGLVEVLRDQADRRTRTLKLTDDGLDLLARAFPVWKSTHEEVEELLPDGDANGLRKELRALSS